MPTDTNIINIVTIDNEEDSRSSAAKLAGLLFLQKRVKYSLTSIDTPNVSTQNADGYLFIGHTSRREKLGLLSGSKIKKTYGELTAEEFAQQFNNAFNKAVKKKDNIQHIYLIGCEAGLSSRGENDSLAQKIANELHKLGFTKIQVHAIAYEQQQTGESLYVQVIDRDSIASKRSRLGHVEAFFLSREISAEIEKLEQNTKESKNSVTTTQRKIKHLCTLNAHWLTGPAHPIELFNRAENTFNPNEAYEARNERLNKDKAYQTRLKINIEKYRAIKAINQILTSTQERNNSSTVLKQPSSGKGKNIAEVLGELRNDLTRSFRDPSQPTWETVCKKNPEAVKLIQKQLNNIDPQGEEKLTQPHEILPAESKQPLISNNNLENEFSKIEELLKNYHTDNEKIQQNRAQLVAAISQLKQKTTNDLSSGKLNLDEGISLVQQTYKLIEYTINGTLGDGSRISTYMKNTEKFQKSWSWKAILSAIVGAVIGIFIGAAIGAGTGPGAAITALLGGAKGALIGAAAGGVSFSLSGAGVHLLWAQQQDPIKKIANTAEAISRFTPIKTA